MLLLPDHVQLLDVGRKKAIKLVIKDDNTEDKVKVKDKGKDKNFKKYDIIVKRTFWWMGLRVKGFKNNHNLTFWLLLPTFNLTFFSDFRTC